MLDLVFLAMTISPGERRKAFLVICLAIFVAMLGIGIIIPFLPIYAEEMGASGVWLGVIFSGWALARALVMPFMGRLSDIKGRKTILALGLFFYAILSVAYIAASTAPMLAVIRWTHGLAAAMVLPIATAYIGDLAREAGEGKAMGIFNFALFAGFGFGPLMGGVLNDILSFAAAFLAMGVLSFVSLILVLLFLPDLRNTEEGSGEPERPRFRLVLGDTLVQGILSFRFIQAVGRGAVSTFLPIFAARMIGLSTSAIGLIISVQVLAISLFQYPMGVLADRTNRRFLVVAGLIGSSLCIFILPHTYDFLGLFLVTMASGMIGSLSLPAATAMLVGKGRSLGMGTVMGFFNTAMDLGMIFGPLIGGVIFDQVDLPPVFYFGGMMGLVGVGAFWYLTRGIRDHNSAPAIREAGGAEF